MVATVEFLVPCTRENVTVFGTWRQNTSKKTLEKKNVFQRREHSIPKQTPRSYYWVVIVYLLKFWFENFESYIDQQLHVPAQNSFCFGHSCWWQQGMFFLYSMYIDIYCCDPLLWNEPCLHPPKVKPRSPPKHKHTSVHNFFKNWVQCIFSTSQALWTHLSYIIVNRIWDILVNFGTKFGV